jgi:asparagine synthase (glutamine-hydrolysing)
MCGITGIFSENAGEITPDLLQRMTKTLKHRGPDDEDYVFINTSTGRYEPRSGDESAPELRTMMKHVCAPIEFQFDLALGHRRLSILDLSAAGHQPMGNEEGSIWIVHNGEIYNHAELREELKDKGHLFKSRTDTEVILHSYEQWGEACLNRFNGMWAFAIWDSRSQKLFCSRDRFGIKPFYYFFKDGKFVFASEIKALLETGLIERKPNNQSIFDYVSYGLKDCTEDTYFDGIKQLRGGHYLEFNVNKKEFKLQRYYDIPLIRRSKDLTDEEYALQFRQLLEDSIRLRLESDVPAGTCLSGGLDSSSIVCLIDKLRFERGSKLPGASSVHKTFSARFTERGYDEGSFIQDVVKKTGVDAYYTFPTGENTWEKLPLLIWHQEEPCGRQYLSGQWEVYKLAKQSGVKVVLDGQGGDELLAGYGIYYAALFAYLMRTFHWPELMRESVMFSRLYGKSSIPDLLKSVYHFLPGQKRAWVRGALRVDGDPCLSDDFKAGRTGYWFKKRSESRIGADLFDQYLYDQFTNFILPSLLHDQDKNSMAHSIESRLPFLDYRLVELVFSMPWQQKIRRGRRKYVLRNAMKGILPESIEKRMDKMGFANPIDAWLKKSFGAEVADIIGSQSFKQRVYFDPRKVQEAYKAHQNGQKHIARTIWRWVNLELWLRMYIDRSNSLSSE